MPLEMGQCPVLETVGNSLAADGLLADTSYHLRNVDERALGACSEGKRKDMRE